MGLIEIIAVIFSLACVVLTARRNVWCWIVGIIGIIFYAILFYEEKLYADMLLQGIYFLQSLYGLEMWIKNQKPSSYKVGVRTIEYSKLTSHVFLCVIIWAILSIILDKYTDASMPVIDAMLSVFSVLANYYLTKRIVDSWYIWILLDTVYIWMFASKNLYLSSTLYSIFFIMAVYGLLEWKKELKNTRKVSY